MIIYHLRCDECGREGTMTKATEVCPECGEMKSVFTCTCKDNCGVKMCHECLNAMGTGHHWRVFAEREAA